MGMISDNCINVQLGTHLKKSNEITFYTKCIKMY